MKHKRSIWCTWGNCQFYLNICTCKCFCNKHTTTDVVCYSMLLFVLKLPMVIFSWICVTEKTTILLVILIKNVLQKRRCTKKHLHETCGRSGCFVTTNCCGLLNTTTQLAQKKQEKDFPVFKLLKVWGGDGNLRNHMRLIIDECTGHLNMVSICEISKLWGYFKTFLSQQSRLIQVSLCSINYYCRLNTTLFRRNSRYQ